MVDVAGQVGTVLMESNNSTGRALSLFTFSASA